MDQQQPSPFSFAHVFFSKAAKDIGRWICMLGSFNIAFDYYSDG